MAPWVRYNPPNFSDTYQRTYLRQTIKRKPHFDSDRAALHRRRVQILQRLRPDIYTQTANITIGDEEEAILEFTETPAYFHDRTREDTFWECDDILGSGSFGNVGLWLKKDDHGTIVDKLAIKELLFPDARVLHFGPNNLPIPEEAIIQTALQKKNCPAILQLRQMKAFRYDNGMDNHNRLRLYLEYCPYGDLSDLLDLYCDFNEENDDLITQIPEAFIWQIFLRFTQVIASMQDAPFDHPANQSLGVSPFILHMDVKPENIFVSDPEDEDIIQGYSACKVGDWGIARLTSLSDESNSSVFMSQGTRIWRPPEQMDNNRFGDHWDVAPPWSLSGHPTDDYPYTTAHSVFTFASIIFALMILDRDNDTIAARLQEAHTSETHVRDANFEWINQDDLETDVYGNDADYSDLLKSTVIQCLCINPAQRPSVTELHRIVTRQCRRLRRLQQGPIDPRDPTFTQLRYGKSGRGNPFPGGRPGEDSDSEN